ncbi:hypothetical protein NC651_028079 [Populus alba x Populus x berolinensis]|nr:hypothetical protein NC651_028079 [Populus alba x Populus x berolinensis]
MQIGESTYTSTGLIKQVIHLKMRLNTTPPSSSGDIDPTKQIRDSAYVSTRLIKQIIQLKMKLNTTPLSSSGEIDPTMKHEMADKQFNHSDWPPSYNGRVPYHFSPK